MISYDKKKVRELLTTDIVFDMLVDFGGEPQYSNFGIISQTICHNRPGEGSRKLYYYENTGLFHCYTGCGDSFDPFQLVIKVANIQWGRNYDLNDAVRYVAITYGINVEIEDDEETELDDWPVFSKYDRIQSLDLKDYHVKLKPYDASILDKFNYHVKIKPWLDEHISQEVLNRARIGYYAGGAQITIPHYDKDGDLIGLRGRLLDKSESELYGKYMPLKIGQQLYNHALGMNLYNINNSWRNIQQAKCAIIFESEKSCLKYQTYFGIENDISVACCGSNISMWQVQMLLDAGATEMIIAFDRQFQDIGDWEWRQWTKHLISLNNKFKNYINVSIIFDTNMITGYKDAPIDDGVDTFLELWKNRVRL